MGLVQRRNDPRLMRTLIAAAEPDEPGRPQMYEIPEVPKPDDLVQKVQAAAEGAEVVDDGRSVEFLGARFRTADKVGLMPLMKFAMTARKGVESDDLEGLAAMYSLIRDCVDQTRPQKAVLDEDGEPLIQDGKPVTEDDGPSEWDRFEQHAIDSKAEAEDLFGVVSKVIEALSARKAPRPGDSSAGPPTTSGSSKAISSSTATRRVPEGFEEMVPVADLIAHREARLTG